MACPAARDEHPVVVHAIPALVVQKYVTNALCRSMNADIFGADDDKCRHIASSETLFNYLRETLSFTFEPIGTNYSLILQPVIIFFQNISGFRAGVGDHIDYWNGRTYFNAVSGTSGPSGNLNLFR